MFSSLGVTFNQLPSLKNTYHGPLIIAGGGRCVWDDLSQIDQSKEWDVMCINDILMHFPSQVTHAYSNDDRWLKRWLSARRPRYTQNHKKPVLHTCQKGEGMVVWPIPGHGSSGLNAIYVGLALGYEEIVLCGIPLDDSGHYFDPPWIKTNFVREIGIRNGEIKYWANAKEHIFQDKVRSISGRTRELLGGPDNNPGDSAFG